MRTRRTEADQSSKTLLHNPMAETVACDSFVAPTVAFQCPFCLFVRSHERLRILHVNVTRPPTAEWAAQHVVEAFPGDGWTSTVPAARSGRRLRVSVPSEAEGDGHREVGVGAAVTVAERHAASLPNGLRRRGPSRSGTPWSDGARGSFTRWQSMARREAEDRRSATGQNLKPQGASRACAHRWDSTVVFARATRTTHRCRTKATPLRRRQAGQS